MTETPKSIRAARAGRAATVAATDNTATDLVKAWARAWDTLTPEFEAAFQRLIDARAGDVIGAGQLARDRRLMQALARALDVTDELAAEANALVSAQITPLVLAAADAHYEQLTAQLPEEAPGRFGLGVLDPAAVDEIVARTVGQIEAATLALPVVQAEAMKKALIQGIVVGANPRRVAREIMKRTEGAFMGGAVRAERIARTEMLSAHRATDQASAIRNRSVVAAQVWYATLDTRTCPACLGMHGTEFPPDAYGPVDHPNGRCTFVTRTKTAAELGFHGVTEPPAIDHHAERDAWWNNLTETAQNEALGKARADLIRSGAAQWSDMATLKRNPEWMDHYVQTPLKDLPAG